MTYSERVKQLLVQAVDSQAAALDSLPVPYLLHFKVWHDHAGCPRFVTFDYQQAQPTGDSARHRVVS